MKALMKDIDRTENPQKQGYFDIFPEKNAGLFPAKYFLVSGKQQGVNVMEIVQALAKAK
jgi:hypothetical protein